MSDRRKERELVCRMLKAGIVQDLKRKLPLSQSALIRESTSVFSQCKTYYRLYASVLEEYKSNPEDHAKKLAELQVFSVQIEEHVAKVYRILGITDEEPKFSEIEPTTNDEH
jgi:hypothetical protein